MAPPNYIFFHNPHLIIDIFETNPTCHSQKATRLPNWGITNLVYIYKCNFTMATMMVYETHNCSIHGVIIQQTSLGASIQGERMAPKTQVVRRVCATTGLGLLFHRLPVTRGLKRRALADAQPRSPSMSKYPVKVL